MLFKREELLKIKVVVCVAAKVMEVFVVPLERSPELSSEQVRVVDETKEVDALGWNIGVRAIHLHVMGLLPRGHSPANVRRRGDGSG